jgi:2-succinyl-6-hydroxy-2,4-cyclohexadiene-1-carboxylate synthase
VTRQLVDGVRYEVRVSGNGPPLLLLHGFTGRGAHWGPHLPVLGRSFTTIVVDLLGHGRSDSPEDPARHAVEWQAADLAVIIGHVAGGPADVIGYSFGARVALMLALDAPLSVRRLVLESPSAGIADPVERHLRRAADEALATDLERDGTAAFVARWESLPLFASQADLSPAARRRLHDGRLRNRPSGLSASLRGAGQGTMTSLHSRLSQVRAATLVVTGELDPVRARSELVARGIPGARLAVVDGVGHAPDVEAPTRFRAVVMPFISAQNAPAPTTTAEEIA